MFEITFHGLSDAVMGDDKMVSLIHQYFRYYRRSGTAVSSFQSAIRGTRFPFVSACFNKVSIFEHVIYLLTWPAMSTRKARSRINTR